MRFLFSLCLVSAAFLSGCTSLSIDELSVSKALAHQLPRTWDAKLHSKSKEADIPVKLYINGVSAELSKTSKFHDVDILMQGSLVISEKEYATHTPININFGSHSELNANDNTLVLSNVLVRTISLPELPKSYSVDMIPAITESLNEEANKHIQRVVIVNLNHYRKGLFQLNNAENLKKSIEGNRIKVANK